MYVYEKSTIINADKGFICSSTEPKSKCAEFCGFCHVKTRISVNSGCTLDYVTGTCSLFQHHQVQVFTKGEGMLKTPFGPKYMYNQKLMIKCWKGWLWIRDLNPYQRSNHKNLRKILAFKRQNNL